MIKKITSFLTMLLMLFVSIGASAQEVDATEFENKAVAIGTAVNAITPNTWYVIFNGTRANEMGAFVKVGENPGVGGVLYDDNDVIAKKKNVADIKEGDPAKNFLHYFVRLIEANEDGEQNVYQVQFATGKYLASNLYTISNKYDSGKFNIYPINDNTEGLFGFNKYNMANLVNNNGVNGSLAYWKSGEIKSTDYNELKTADTYSSVWSIHPVILTGMDARDAAYKDLVAVVGEYEPLIGNFPTGTLPGQYDAELLEAFKASINAVKDLDQNPDVMESMTAEDFQAMAQAIKDAYEALVASKVPYTLADGYYRIKSGLAFFVKTTDEETLEEKTTYVDKYMYSQKSGETISGRWGTPEDLSTDATALWKVTNAEEGNFDIVNVGTDARFNNVATSTAVGMSTTSENLMAIDPAITLNDIMYVNIRVSTQAANNYFYLHTGGHASGEGVEGNLIGWANSASQDAVAGSEWVFLPVSDEEAQAVIDAYAPIKEREVMLQRYDSIRALAEEKLEIAIDADNENAQFNHMGDLGTNLQNVIAAQTELERDDITINEYNTLKEALDNFLEVFVDPTELRQVLNDTKNVADVVATGTNPGYWPEGSETADYSDLYNEAVAYDASGEYTAEQTARYVQGLTQGAEDIYASANGIQEGKWYRIRFAYEDDFDAHGWDKVAGNGTENGKTESLFGKYATICSYSTDEEGYEIHEALSVNEIGVGQGIYFDDDMDINDNAMSEFRFINVGDSAYMLQNHATGLFVKAAGTSGATTLSAHPTLFNVRAIGYGANVIAAKNINGEAESYLHAQVGGNILVTWNVSELGSRSALWIEEAGDVEPDYDGSTFNILMADGSIGSWCFPVEVSVESSNGQIWGLNSIDGNNITLCKLDKATAGRPFLLVCGDLDDYDPEVEEEEVVRMKLTYEISATEPNNCSELKGTFKPLKIGYGHIIASGNKLEVSKKSNTMVGANGAYISKIGELFDLETEINIVWSNSNISIKLECDTLSLPKNSIDTLKVTSSSVFGVITWMSSNTSVVIVDESGVVTGVGAGTANIIASVDGYEPDTCVVIVTTSPVSGIRLSESAVTIHKGLTHQLTATVLPSDASNTNVIWSSTDETVATVDENGLVTAVGKGTAMIIALTEEGYKSAMCMVTVDNVVTSVGLSNETLTIAKGGTAQLTATCTPADADDLSLTWASSDETVATVDATGLVTAIGKGTATITVTAATGVSAQCVVTVTNPMTSFRFANATLTLQKGSSQALTLVPTPVDADPVTLVWSSTDEMVATVDENGVLTAIDLGTTVIVAYSPDLNKSATCVVTVTKKDITLADGTPYANDTEEECGTITYTRTFNNTNFQALYVPFEMTYADWQADFEVYYIDNIRQHDDNGDGVIDRTMMDIFLLKEGSSLYANMPYIIRAKTTGEKTITLTDTTLYPAEENSLECSSTSMRYTITGTYEGVSSSMMDSNSWYALGGGSLIQTDGSNNLGAFRWYLSAESKGGVFKNSLPNEIKLQVINDDETGIGNLNVNLNANENCIYDLSGRRVNANAYNSKSKIQNSRMPKGMYIVNGRKVVIK